MLSVLEHRIKDKDISAAQDDVSPTDEQGRASQLSRASLKDKIKAVLSPLLQSLGLELFDLQISGRQLRVFIDKTGGVSLGDCEQLSRLLGPALDVADHIPNAYTLEVSSPGLNRPLRHEEDYHRFIGKRVKIKTTEKLINQKVFIGRLCGFKDETVDLRTDEGMSVQIPYCLISTGCLEVEFPSEPKKKG